MSVIIRLQNLPMSANASNIRRFFAGLAIPEGGVHIVGGNDGDAFIAFATDEDARKAMLLDRQAINGAPVRLFLSSKTEMQSVIDSARSSALFSNVATTQSVQPSAPQKTETMQALDVTAPTLPSSFPSYRNGAVREPYPSERQDQYGYNQNRPSSPLSSAPLTRPKFDSQRTENYSDEHAVSRIPERQVPPEPLRVRDYDYSRPPPQYGRYDGLRDRPLTGGEFGSQSRDHTGFESASRVSSQPYRSHYGEPNYDRRPPDSHFALPRPKDGSREDTRSSYADSRFTGRMPPENQTDYNRDRSPLTQPDRFASHESRDPREISDANQPYDLERRPLPVYPNERDSQYPPVRSQNERDFSIRPPWLNDENLAGPKRSFQNSDYDDYPRKRRPPPPTSRPSSESTCPGETDLVVRVTLPLSEMGVKAIFEVLRGVHIVAKWGIRLEEDALQRHTGYVFIMMTGRESYDRALAYDGRTYRGKRLSVVPSSLSEFYKVTDSSFHLKCPPEIAKKLPSSDQPSTPPHHADGCLEVAELPPDTTRTEVVRFLGAPGLSVSDITIATFAPSDKTAPKTPGTVRALVSLPSAKDIDILLSAKPRPLRPDGAFPPVRLTPISKIQLEAYAMFRIEEKSKPTPEPVSTTTVELAKPSSGSLTCAYLSGLARFMKDSEVVRLFPNVLIPGDAIRMVGPDNTSGFIDFISENNCRRAVADISNTDSNAKLSHPDIRIEAISRSEMESRLGSAVKDEETPPTTTADHRPSRPSRDRDPRDAGRPWDSRPPPRVGRHPSPAPTFRPRSPPTQPVGRPKYEEPYYDHNIPPPPFDDGHRMEPYGGGPRRPRPPMDIQHSAPPLPHPSIPGDYMLPPRSGEPMPPRRPGPDFVTVHIGNLPPGVTVEQLSSVMRDYYFVPGSIRLRRDIQGMPTGEGLVDFNSCYDGDRAIRDLNGYRMGGRLLVLQYDRRP